MKERNGVSVGPAPESPGVSVEMVHVVDPALYALRLIIDALQQCPDEESRVKALRCVAGWYGYELRHERSARGAGKDA